MATEQERIVDLEAQLARAQSRSSAWTLAKDLATILTPLVLLGGGYAVQKSMARDSAALTERLDQQQQRLDLRLETIRDSRQESAQKIEQSKLLTSLMPAMLSNRQVEQQLAINIALHACGEAGRQVVAAVSVSDPYASTQLSAKRASLVQQLIDHDAHQRWQAAQELGTTWASDPALLPDLAAFARTNAATPMALYNTLVVLGDVPTTTYIGQTKLVRAVLALVQHAGLKGAKTAALVQAVQAKLAAAASTPGNG